ncbi:uncharacterized protein VDAG_06612, partial [Verticillium dahliae VdLs.17]
MEPHNLHISHLTALVVDNLRDQHDWTNIRVQSPANNVDGHLPRPVLSGLPPRRIYVHPDEQIEALQSGQPVDTQAAQRPELEWVVPVHITEKLSLRKFSAI